MRSGRQQQKMIGSIPEKLSQAVTGSLARRRRPRHPMRLVHDHQVPMDLAKSRQNVIALGEIEGSKNLLLLQPLVDPELIADITAFNDEKFFVELFLELTLPLKREVRWTNDQNALGEASQLELADQEPGHDRLSRARVVSQEKPDTGRFEEIIINGLKLMRQRIDAGNREAKIWIELVGDPKRVGL